MTTPLPTPSPALLRIVAPDGVDEVLEGDDLAGLLLGVCDVADGDIVTITSKVVSKAEGRQRTGERSDALADETVRVVARRGPTSIVRNRLGLTMAAAGIDGSNVTAGDYLLLPIDPDRTAREVRTAVRQRTGANVGVVITDTAGRPWRTGQTDIAIGAAGVLVLEDYAGRTDDYGNPLAVTAPAVADELAGAAELATGKLGSRPFTVISGRADLVLTPDDHGTGAGMLIREDGGDMFGYGSREAVLRALTHTGAGAFGSAAPSADLADALAEVLGSSSLVESTGDTIVVTATHLDPAEAVAIRVLAFAFGWTLERRGGGGPAEVTMSLQPACP